jgi:hypothetical protein
MLKTLQALGWLPFRGKGSPLNARGGQPRGGRDFTPGNAMRRTCPQCGGALPAEGFEGLCPRCVALCLDEFESRAGPGNGEAPEPAPRGGEPRPSGAPSATAAGGSAAPATSINPSIHQSTFAATADAGLAAPGTPLGQRIPDYELLEEIGRGGMGVVYRARQLSLNRIVAVKTILSGPVASAQAVQRFRSEAEALARLKHPNIVAIYDIFEWESHHFFSMEYVPGKNLAELAQAQPLPPALAARYARKIAFAIQFAHENGLLHRDLKPSNILIDAFDEPRVTDFGLAKRLNAEADLSYTGQLVGSPQYFAPEQLSCKKGDIGPRTDIYSIGAVLYHLLAGRPPFNAASLEEVLLEVIDTEPPAPRSLVPGIPRDLETICLKCLEKEPARRYASARAVAEDLAHFMASEPIEARPVRAAERAWRWCGRQKALAGAWAALLLLLVAFALVLSRRDAGSLSGRAPTLPLTVAYSFADRLFYDTNWTLIGQGFGSGSGPQAKRIGGYTNASFQFSTNPVREMTYKVGSNSTVLAFHLCPNAAYDPALRGEIRELTASFTAQSLDGAGNTRLAPCLEQDGRRYSYIRPKAASCSILSESGFRGMTANDFALPAGPGYEPGRHPDFSPQGKPIRFGLVVRDTDPKRGHFGWVAVSAFSVTAFGPAPANFPFSDPSFDDRDWTVRAIANGGAAEWEEVRKRNGGNPGKYLALTATLGDRTHLELIHLCRGALYSPALQGALDNLDFSLDTRMAPETSGRSVSPNIKFVIVQNGAVYETKGQGVSYTDQNGGWATLDLMGVSASMFPDIPALPRAPASPAYPDFSTNGAAMRFGFSTDHDVYANNAARHGFQTAIDFDNFVIKVHPLPPAR